MTKTTLPVASGVTKKAALIGAAGLMALGLAGCRNQPMDGLMVGFQSPQPSVEERHAIQVGKETTDLELSVVAGHGLNGSQRAQLHNFVGLWRHEGTGQFMIGSPGGAGAEAVADIRKYLNEVDVPKAAVRVLHGGGGQRSVKLSFLRYVATGPDCGRFNKNLAENRKNENFGNFGCARQHNVAAMIANPRDLLMPRGMDTERSGERRDVVFDKYINGDGTGANKTADEKAGQISDVAKN
jgi:pilus assembly protein CpaD